MIKKTYNIKDLMSLINYDPAIAVQEWKRAEEKDSPLKELLIGFDMPTSQTRNERVHIYASLYRRLVGGVAGWEINILYILPSGEYEKVCCGLFDNYENMSEVYKNDGVEKLVVKVASNIAKCHNIRGKHIERALQKLLKEDLYKFMYEQ